MQCPECQGSGRVSVPFLFFFSKQRPCTWCHGYGFRDDVTPKVALFPTRRREDEDWDGLNQPYYNRPVGVTGGLPPNNTNVSEISKRDDDSPSHEASHSHGDHHHDHDSSADSDDD